MIVSFFSGIWFDIRMFFAGLFPSVVDVILLSSAILFCIIAEFAAAWLDGKFPFLNKPIKWTQKHILVIGMILGGVVIGEYRGAKHEAGICKARAAIVNTVVNHAAATANGNPSRDKFNEDHQ